MGGKINVVEYNPNWVRKFEELMDYVLPVLSDLEVTIEHVGSTAIPGIVAKPIIDMVAVVTSKADVQVAINRLYSWLCT